jgi:hypothetical protein
MIENKGLDLFCIISIHADSTGHLEKGFFIYRPKSVNNELTNTYPALIAHLETITDMQLSSKNE